MAVFGDVNTSTVQRSVGQSLGGWVSSPTPPVPPRCAGADKFTRLVELRDKKQAVIVLGFPGESVAGEDRFRALDLTCRARASDLGSRLFTRIRDELGLAYYVGAHHSCGLEPGSFSFYGRHRPGEGGAWLSGASCWPKRPCSRRRGSTPEELARAKAKMIGQKKLPARIWDRWPSPPCWTNSTILATTFLSVKPN